MRTNHRLAKRPYNDARHIWALATNLTGCSKCGASKGQRCHSGRNPGYAHKVRRADFDEVYLLGYEHGRAS